MTLPTPYLLSQASKFSPFAFFGCLTYKVQLMDILGIEFSAGKGCRGSGFDPKFLG